MKIFGHKLQSRRAIAMTEYLIILAIVAIAAIAIVGLFGQQIKNTFWRNTSTLGGVDGGGAKVSATTGKASGEAGKVDSMNSFDKQKNGSSGGTP
jgi:Flp pilus assembly pilin Flp